MIDSKFIIKLADVCDRLGALQSHHRLEQWQQSTYILFSLHIANM